MTTFNFTYDKAKPGSNDNPQEADDEIRLVKAAVQERENVDHYWPSDGSEVSDEDTGEHQKVTLRVLGSDPDAVPAKGFLYTKDVGEGVIEFFYRDESGKIKQITDAGALNIAIAEIQGILPNNIYFTAIDNAGDGTTNLIKAGQNEAADTDVSILPDLARLVTDAAPLENTAISNKKYVDDSLDAKVGSGTMSPLDYTLDSDSDGRESVTFPNGFIQKWGRETSSTDSEESFSFAVAFPTACNAVFINRESVNSSVPLNVSEAPTAAGFKVNRNSTMSNGSFVWYAIGY